MRLSAALTRRRSIATRVLLVAAVGMGLLVPASAPVTAGVIESGTVVAVNDGDTFDITTSDGQKRVRMLGLNAMELDDYVAKTGECHGPEGFRRLEELVEGKQVRLLADDPASVGLKNRIQRFVEVQIDGVWTDVAEKLLEEGHALWFPSDVEYSNNVRYQRAVRRAQAKGINLWDNDFCGAGPQQAAKFKMWVQWDADGVDSVNVNGEWVRIKNTGSTDTNIGGWMLRESALRSDHSENAPLRQYMIPAGTIIPARKSITIHVGRGTNTANRLYWGQNEPVFENADPDGHNDGDGAYLYDPDGDIRAYFMYPCLKASCPDPNKGKIKVTRVVYDPDGVDTANKEFIRIAIPKSVSKKRIRLEGYLLENWPYSYAFKAGDVLRKGRPMKIILGQGEDTARRKYWGFTKTILNNTGDTAKIRTYDNIVLHCKSWGNARC